MIDLSFLTEEEQETILGVLHRDARLKQAEETRVKNLQLSVRDKGLLKYLSGEWFYETKLLRHRDRIHVELSQIQPKKPSFVASSIQEVHIPPELCGLIPEDPDNRRGILKSMSDQSPTDSLVSLRSAPQSPTDQASAAQDTTPAGRDALGKQVRFVPAVGHGVPQQGAKELGVHSVLDVDHAVGSPSVENHDLSEHYHGRLPQVSNLLSSEQESDLLEARSMSKSVPTLQLEEMDDLFDNKHRKRTASITSNLSWGLASMSSISGSLASISRGGLGDVDVQGTVQFALNYVQKMGELQVFVVQCRDLAVAEPKKSRSDPYVKCYLVPDKTKLGKRKTSVKKKTLIPSFNEILRFKILMEVLKMQKLNISVWHNDTFGRNSFLGEVNLDLSEWDFGDTQINDYALTPRTLTQLPSPPAVSSRPTSDQRGQMRVSLRYLSQPSHGKKTSKTETGEVQIWVKDCKDLPPARGVIIDPFVKCTVLPDISKKSRQKTRVVKRTANPMFNHTMVYDGFRPEDLREACAEITVWDHDRLNNHYVGGLRLGLGTGTSYGAAADWMDSTQLETNLWEKMMDSNGEWVEEILPLRTFVVAKTMAK
ncbi:hypothetical protein NHX12_010439 [Muraenolepis orangiensis]|uniref:Synaptotagmin-like protein 2 n=1 Tax=Muraenolepis orangiensis TaxID=630683 RepID=A0A9Q0DI72_9TELE|nr:hypothetical protein NHX12_010439 [Muraenolepis orangiensis]